MAVYILTEAQLQMIFERKLLTEMDNHNYPAGSDTSAAPWNQDDSNQNSSPISEEGPFQLVTFDGYEYLLKNSANGDLFFTVGDAFNGDIYAAMHDFLSIPQEQYSDEGDPRTGNVQNWEDSVTDEDLANALVNYMNYTYKKNMLNVAENVTEWDEGKGEFLLINPSTIQNDDLTNVIMSDNMRNIVLGSLQHN